MVPDPAPPYEVAMSPLLRDRIKRFSRLANAKGFASAFDASVERIMGMLRMSPRESGDPIRHLRGFTSMQYRIVRDRLIVHYTVHDRIPMVTVWRFEPGPGHPLAPPPANGN